MKKILIANRGEIAVRIIRAAREMGINTVAIFSEIDRSSLHVKMADEAYFIGPNPARDSYLNFDSIIEACKLSGAEAIHPGYGFLSENPEFAKRVENEGIIFIGPFSKTMELMGNKLSAKELARKLGVPLVPGSDGPIRDEAEANEVAQKIGFPLLIKAAAGGGGKGMRIVENPSDFQASLETSIRVAQSAFGDGSVFLERYIQSPRHIEIQILADQWGNTVYLFERECSIQRRHQKVIEEAPSSLLTPELREKMGGWAVLLAKACEYKSAGTLEFIVDQDHNFYFLEMNTRLQVEHPATECITGLDLVKEQIRIARGEKLGFDQKDLKIQGHALELRIYAEDPENDFLPDTGILKIYKLPSGPGIRVDNGVEENQEIPIFYDPMLSKLISFGANREEAIERMIRAIGEYKIKGIANTLGFGDFVMKNQAFRSGNFDTHFVQNEFIPFLESQKNTLDRTLQPLNLNSNKENTDEMEIAYYFASQDYLKEKKVPEIPVDTMRTRSSWKNRKWSGT